MNTSIRCVGLVLAAICFIACGRAELMVPSDAVTPTCDGPGCGPGPDVIIIDIVDDLIPIDAPPPIDVGPPIDVPPPPTDSGPETLPGPDVAPNDARLITCMTHLCGNHVTDTGEVCDDGNNRSGDGCRADCLSLETCGNGTVDYSVGELCDGTPGCAADCHSILHCGDGHLDSTEQCDDGNMVRWDGCSPDCRIEEGIVAQAFFVAPDTGRIGCDFDDDGHADNAFGRAMGGAAGLLDSAITNGISNGQLFLQVDFLGLNDETGQNGSNLYIGWINGADGNMNSMDNQDPGNPQRVVASSLNAHGIPIGGYDSTITAGAASGGPAQVHLDLPAPGGMSFSFDLFWSGFNGTVSTDSSRITEFGRTASHTNDGQLCGVIDINQLGAVPNFFAALAGGRGGGGMSSLLAAAALGYSVSIPLLGTFSVGPVQPDVDLDCDGHEMILGTPGSGSTPPRITGCVDGDGTSIPGADCWMDPRMADGYSSAFQLYGPWIRFVGVSM